MLLGRVVVKFGVDFDRFSVPTLIKNRSKIDEKSCPKIDQKKDPFWDPCWVDFGPILETKIDQKWIQNGIKNKSDLKPKTDTRPPTSEVRAWSPAAPLGGPFLLRGIVGKNRIDGMGETKGKGKKRKDVPRQICHAWGPRPSEFITRIQKIQLLLACYIGFTF